jgi:hypothetical protein
LNYVSLRKGFEVNLSIDEQLNLELYSIVKRFGIEALNLPYELIEEFILIEKAGEESNG